MVNYNDAISRYDDETKTGANPVTLTSPGRRPDPRIASEADAIMLTLFSAPVSGVSAWL